MRPRDLNVVAELGLQESSQTAVEEGLGATFTSLAAIERELELGRLEMARVTGLSLRRDYVVVRQAAREPSRLAAAFVAFCREAAARSTCTQRSSRSTKASVYAVADPVASVPSRRRAAASDRASSRTRAWRRRRRADLPRVVRCRAP